MNSNKKNMLITVILSIVCIAAGLVCTILNKWNLTSIILLACIVALAIFINIALWRTIVLRKRIDASAAELNKFE